MYKVKIYSFTEAGNSLSKKILGIQKKVFRCEKLVFEKSEKNIIEKEDFYSSNAHVFIGAMGIAVRKIAPYISDKKKDPAVVVIDEKGQFIIPVLSGHVGGANDLALLIADSIKAKAILTTATDVNGINAIDLVASRSRLEMSPLDAARTVNSKLLKGEKIKVFIDKDIEIIEDKTNTYELSNLDDCDVAVVNLKKYIVGIGCRKNIDSDIFKETVDKILDEYNVRYMDIDRIASIDLKQNEEAILRYSKNNQIMFETYSADELEGIDGDFDESNFVKEITGVSNVSERVCVYAGNMLGNGEFILKRKAENGITISIYKVVKRIVLNGKA